MKQICFASILSLFKIICRGNKCICKYTLKTFQTCICLSLKSTKLNIHLIGHTKEFTLFLDLNLTANVLDTAHEMPRILLLTWQPKNNEFSNMMLNGSDFIAKTIIVLKWDYKRATMEVYIHSNHLKTKERYNTFFFSFAVKRV